jgi:hypothetical protein
VLAYYALSRHLSGDGIVIGLCRKISKSENTKLIECYLFALKIVLAEINDMDVYDLALKKLLKRLYYETDNDCVRMRVGHIFWDYVYRCLAKQDTNNSRYIKSMDEVIEEINELKKIEAEHLRQIREIETNTNPE